MTIYLTGQGRVRGNLRERFSAFQSQRLTQIVVAGDAEIETALETDEDEDPDAEGQLVMEFADGTKCILNRQTAAHQIWLAEGATAWHFADEDGSGSWLDTKGRGPLIDVLREVLERRLGHPVAL